jgi:tetratricopeptide (TPR) repeat protein
MTYYLLKVKYKKLLKNTKTLNMQELDHAFPRVKRIFGEGSMMELMSNENAPRQKRMKALSIMAEDMNQKNIALIKHSLADKDDEIRLFSFSLLDKLEQNINTKIHLASVKFENEADEEKRVNAAKELAYLYWDMIYFDLSDDILKEFLIKESLKYANIAFKYNMRDTAINILLGKIYLVKNEYEQAETQFVMAIESGVQKEYIIPYLAELYFERGNYRSIRAMLNVVHGLGINAKLYPVVAQWEADA